METIEQDVDFCEICNADIKEGGSHDWRAHGSTKESANELAAWKQKLAETESN
jgi:hypothetical protein